MPAAMCTTISRPDRKVCNRVYSGTAIRKGETAMQRMANMVLATEAAARRGLGHNLRERLSRTAAKLSRSNVTSEKLS
jgi:hypothetical protein